MLTEWIFRDIYKKKKKQTKRNLKRIIGTHSRSEFGTPIIQSIMHLFSKKKKNYYFPFFFYVAKTRCLWPNNILHLRYNKSPGEQLTLEKKNKKKNSVSFLFFSLPVCVK